MIPSSVPAGASGLATEGGLSLRESATLAHPTMSSRLSLLVDLASLLSREVELDALMSTACDRLRVALECERATIWLIDAEREDLVSRVAVLPEVPQLRLRLDRGIAGFVARTGDTVRTTDATTDPRFEADIDRQTGYVTRSVLAVPIRESASTPIRGVLQLLNHTHGAFSEEDARYLAVLAAQLCRALELTTLRARGEEPGVVLRGPFNRIVGRSDVLGTVYERITLAAQTDATVLLRGETGTGKGLFARAIHVNSKRQEGPFVTVDATTLPRDLVESELFGHERGSFTGADRRVQGRVELAQGGTLFLDEIGDLSFESQGKLLRLLQDRAFERVGGRATLQADVRVVCATHRDLERAVRDGTFRSDLYYRIRVVEIEVPRLKDRGAEDILELAMHFADMYARRYGRAAPSFTEEARSLLLAYAFPGNVRELEHWIESAVVLSKDGRLRPENFPKVRDLDAPREEGSAVRIPLGLPLDEVERLYTAATLDESGGNQTIAAKRLGIGRNTLARRTKKP
jgi:transcriptional regulator with GAF, ATPase, and Fis domain